jgi:hypothetical protein
MKRLQADNADEGLHGVVGEHAAAAANAWTRITCDAVPHGLVRVSGYLVGADDVQHLTGFRILAWADRAVGHDDCRFIPLKDCSHGADRWLVTGDHSNGAGQTGALPGARTNRRW